VLAWWVRVGVLLVPLVVSVVVALVVIAVLPGPEGWLGHVAWWVAVLGAAYGAALVVDRVARRALPLAVLLRLSLVFPDRAPSRLKTARRTSLREIEHQVASLERAGAEGGPAEAARTLVALVGALGLHDKRTRGHSERVRAYVDMLSEEMGLVEEDRVRLRWAALIHDIGKLSVPGPVLNGGRDLADDDWAALRRHPAEGERLAGALLPWLGEWGLCVRQHHEHWDGSGYPHGLHGTEISLGARIVAVADAFEVMTANRSYQTAIKATAAREELARCAGKDFDPAVVRAFLQISIGRLRGVLGPLSFLPALPLAALGDRAGRAAQGMTTVAAVSAVALTTAGGTPTPITPAFAAPAPSISVPTTAPSPAALAVPTASPLPAPRPVAPAPVLPSPAAVALPPPSHPAPPASPPAATPPLLYLGVHADLLGVVSVSGTVWVPGGGRPVPFSHTLSEGMTLTGVPRMVLFDDLRTRHGRGLPSATVRVTLADCFEGSCRTLSTGSASVVRRRSGYGEQSVSMSPVDVVVASGHDLRVTLALVSHDNATGMVVALGGRTSSRLLLG